MRDHYLANSLLVVVSLLSAGCNTGYTKSNGKWTYIIINEAVGREVRAIDADVTTFKVHPNPAYASDKNHVYRYGLVLEGFDGATYRQLPDGEYSIDANGVYWWDSLIEAADPNSFRVLKGPYSRDDKHVFCGTLRMNVEDPDQFQVISTGEKNGPQGTRYYYSAKELVDQFGDEFADRKVKFDRKNPDDRFRVVTSQSATATDGTWLFTGPKRARKISK